MIRCNTIPTLTLTEIDRFWARVNVTDNQNECWGWLAWKTSKGYGALRLRGVSLLASRVAFSVVNKRQIGNLFVCHTCDNPLCVNPKHLFLGTQKDNMADRNKKGRTARGDNSGPRTKPEKYPRGAMHYKSKLTQEMVDAIRDEYRKGKVTCRGLANQYKVSAMTISNVIKEKFWK